MHQAGRKSQRVFQVVALMFCVPVTNVALPHQASALAIHACILQQPGLRQVISAMQAQTCAPRGAFAR